KQLKKGSLLYKSKNRSGSYSAPENMMNGMWLLSPMVVDYPIQQKQGGGGSTRSVLSKKRGKKKKQLQSESQMENK
ncbi:hypothetical protein E2320_004043, partial [Naja naja]